MNSFDAMTFMYVQCDYFLLSDLNIPEVIDQKQNSINGRPDCCYTYCANVLNGICVQCDSFAWAVLNSYDALAAPTNVTKQVHNVTLTPNSLAPNHAYNATNALSARVSIALRNESGDVALSQHAMDSLSYYAYYDGIYYYDDELQDMPYQAISGNCETVPSVTGRCTVPYYVSAATKHSVSCHQFPLIWLSLLLCCLYNAYLATYQRLKYERKLTSKFELTSSSCQNWEITIANEDAKESKTIAQVRRKGNKNPSLFNKYDRKSQITIKSFIQYKKNNNNNTLTYKSCKKINNNIHISRNRKKNSRRIELQLFHYINFNINDWWRRWCEFTSTMVAL